MTQPDAHGWMPIDYPAFIRDLRELWSDSFCEIDGGDMQDLMVKHGIAREEPATKEDCVEDWAIEYDIEPGDMILRYHPDARPLPAPPVSEGER